MSDLKNIQEEYKSSRKLLDPVTLELLKAKAALEKLKIDEKQELKTLDRQGKIAKELFYAEEKKRLGDKVDELTARKKNINDRFTDLSAGYFSQLNPVDEIGVLNDSLPLLLFPLRLETRFKSTGNQQQLWLRVYPDDCNINSKEELLSESEFNNARSFWIAMWKAGGIEAEERGAWKSLVNSHGSGRSAWIIQEYKPLNNKPSKPDSSYKILVVESSLSLSPDEIKAARNYWTDTWLANGNTALINTAYDTLIAATSAVRANEIKLQYEPLNLSDTIPEGIVNEKIKLERIELPGYVPKQSSWTQAAKTNLLPDKFVAVTIKGSTKKNKVFINPVKDNLPVSPDPSLKKEDQIKRDNGNLILNEDLQWIFDFEKAVEAGMAIKINLTLDEIATGFDKVFVVGIRFSSDKTNGSEQLEKLLTDHFYSTNGFSLLKQGTPTNNTEELPSGYSWIDDADESYRNLFKDSEAFVPADEPDQKSDGEKLADCLGISDKFLKIVPNANGRDQLEAHAMNTALFPATMGYFMDEMMDPLFSSNEIEATRKFFSKFVSGRGPIPAIRIGKQPYGILPVSVYSRLRFAEQSSVGISTTTIDTQKSFLQRLHHLIMQMDKTWDSLVPGVAYIGKDGDPHQTLLDVIGLHPTSVEFHQRYAQSIKQLYNQINLQRGPAFAKKVTSYFETKANSILKLLELSDPNVKVPALEKYFLSKPNLLSGPLVDDVPDSEISPVRIYYTKGDTKLNYIEWLASAAPDQIRTENFEGSPSPAALLYLLLRHALLLSQAEAATKLLDTNHLLNDKKAYYDPVLLHVGKNEKGKSKFEHLYNNFPTITGSDDIDTKLVDHLYKPEVLKLDETKNLKEILAALKVLEQTPTARLERLLAEHLDCCSYRIDAWKTGLVQIKLSTQRSTGQQDGKPSKGIYLGAYGWLLNVKPENKVLTDINLSPALNEIFNEGGKLQSDSNNLGYIHAPSLNQAATAAILRNAYDSNKDAGTENPFAINLTSDRVRIAESFLEGIRNGQSLSALLGYQFERGLHDKYSLGQGEVDMFIYPLRKVFPLVADNLINTKVTATDIDEAVEANNLSSGSNAIQTIEANNVIDGLKLINHVKKSNVKTYPYGLPASANLPLANNVQAAAIDNEVIKLTAIHDAIADLVISEQVYQVVQGNFERAAGTAEAFSKGSYPPDIAVKDTPRSGVTLTHRMAIHFDADVAVDPLGTPRSKAEPSVNKWLADNLPPPEKVQCKVLYRSPAQAEVEVIVSQKNLGLQAIDLLYVFNMDTEQAMTELDDRITAFIRYNISLHPKTELKINYTKIVDPVDRSITSFFEVAALIKSLRKIITGNKFLTPAQLVLSPEGQQQSYVLDDVKLKIGVTSLSDGLLPVKTAMEAIINNTSSIKKITDNFKVELTPFITDAAKIASIITSLQQDLKDFLINPTADNKTETLTRFEDKVSMIGVAATINNLKARYGNSLDEYIADFSNFDVLVGASIKQCLSAAMFDNNQTGTGFIHQEIGNVYESIFSKLDKLILRWEDKVIDFEILMTGYDPLGVPGDQFLLLQKAELLISSQQTQPLPADLIDYKINHIDISKAAFDDLLSKLKGLKTNAATTVINFISEAESQIIKIGNHDVSSFDTEKEKNDLGSAKLMLALLKEDIINILSTLIKTLDGKITNCAAVVKQADETTINADKIKLLLSAARLILGEQALLLPQFMLTTGQGNEFENACTSADKLLDYVRTKEDRLFPIEDWLGGVARVREKVHHWENASFLYSAFKPTAELDMVALQFPYMPDDRWLAMKFRDETDPDEKDEDGNFKFKINNDKLLYSAHFVKPFDKSKPQCGVVIDEWTEVIPSDKETTGIAFHYDQPNSEPPQTMLLVTPPAIEGNWKWGDIIDAMDETLDMAKKRAIEPAQIENTNYAHFLPATLMAVTMHPITIAVNFSAMNKFNLEN